MVCDLEAIGRAIATAEPMPITGTVVRATGLLVEAALPRVSVGTACEILTRDGVLVGAEVVGFQGGIARLMPLGDIRGIGEGCAVVPRVDAAGIPVGDALLGRVLDPAMRPLDGGPVPILPARAPLAAPPPLAMTRRRIDRPLELGIRSIDAMLTIGQGQRLGIMAGPGVGKSVLMGMLARGADVDVIAVGLVGERGREVREFIERDLGTAGLKRSVVVVATSDEPPVMRVRAAMAATAAAEYFRSRGKRVLLLVDSLSRICMAQREIGLAAGEPPTTKGYPPSVFALMPRLLERAGNDAGRGSITAFYTVLAEGDDQTDPVVDAARSVLDGHLVLSRKLAESGHFPAVDVLASVSRVMSDVATPEHLELARDARELLAAYRDSADLVEVGAYAPGSNPRVDRALKVLPALEGFLRQGPNERSPLPQALEMLRTSLRPAPGGRRA